MCTDGWQSQLEMKAAFEDIRIGRMGVGFTMNSFIVKLLVKMYASHISVPGINSHL